jgi:RNA polymerase sigma-70 factor (ECF subfamily)
MDTNQNHSSAKDLFLTAYETYADEIFRFVQSKVSIREQAQDITQEAFMRLWQTLRQETVLKNERAFLYTVARNLVIDWYRKKKESSLDVLQELGVEFAGTERVEEFAEMNEVLIAVESLDDNSRSALKLRYLDGYTPQEIAQQSGESANAISVRINRAIKKVQGALQA